MMLLVREPSELRSLCVRMGRHLVFLPEFEVGLETYGHFAELPDWPPTPLS